MDSYEDVISDLLAASHRLHPEGVVPLFATHLPRLGLHDVAIFVADLEQRVLVQLHADGEPLNIDGTLAGRAFRTDTVLESTDIEGRHPEGAVRLLVPMLDGAERVGVLAVTVAAVDDVVVRRAKNAASLAATMIIAKEPFGDAIVLARRLRRMDVAAELRWSLLPPLNYINDQVAISGVLEPAYEIAGDTFDYAVNGDCVHIAILDAMGHGLEASRMANLAVGSYRNARRHGGTPEELFRLMDELVSQVFGSEKFVTGQLGLLDTAVGRLRWINAGHPQPVLLRGTAVLEVTTETCLPFGLGDVPAFSTDVVLQPGDTVLFFTDGVTEARSPSGEPFGRDRLAQLLVRTTAEGDPLPETARKLSHAVLAHQEGHLQDDATLLLLKWTGGGGR